MHYVVVHTKTLHLKTVKMTFNKATLRADIILLLVAMIWGLAFVAQRKGMEDIGPFGFNGIRFLLGGLSLLPLVLWGRRIKKRNNIGFRKAMAIKAALIMGLVLFVAASFQQIGVVYTTAGHAGFITSLYVVVVPLISLFKKVSINKMGWAAAILALIGLFLLSYSKDTELLTGDILVLVSTLFWAIHVILASHYAPKMNIIKLSSAQFIICGILSLSVSFIIENNSWADVQNATLPILYGGLMSVGLGYTLQLFAQKKAPASHAAVLLSLESLFAALGGWLLLGEHMTTIKITGALLMLAAVILSQMNKPKSKYLET